MSEDHQHYKIRELIGKGGVGRVFMAFDENIKRDVAVKEPVTDKEGANKERILARFTREARITGQLEHPNIIPVYALNNRADGSIYYVMRYVNGRTFYKAIKDCETGDPEDSFRKRMGLLNNFIEVCEAMGYAHSKGVIHRDLKPGNIILGEFGETVIIDWGVAKYYKEEVTNGPEGPVDVSTLTEDLEEAATRQDEILGTPTYMAPEQVDSKFGTVDPRSDVYSLGVILFMLLTGEKPYPGKGREVLQFITEPVFQPDPSDRYGAIPKELVVICKKAMSKDMNARFGDASEMVKELKAYRDGRIVSVYDYSKAELFKRFVARNRLAMLFASLTVIAMLGGLAFSVDLARKAQGEKLVAEKALTDVTALSESSMSLASDVASDINARLKRLAADMKNSKDPSSLIKRYPDVEELFMAGNSSREAPPDEMFRTDDGHYAFYVSSGGMFAKVRVDKLTLSAIPFDPLRSTFQIWCMNDKGDILYDEDPAQIGKRLFGDAMYAKFPELIKFGDKMKDKAMGIGYYSFFEKGSDRKIYKIAAWDVINPGSKASWKLVATYPYIPK